MGLVCVVVRSFLRLDAVDLEERVRKNDDERENGGTLRKGSGQETEGRGWRAEVG